MRLSLRGSEKGEGKRAQFLITVSLKDNISHGTPSTEKLDRKFSPSEASFGESD